MKTKQMSKPRWQKDDTLRRTADLSVYGEEPTRDLKKRWQGVCNQESKRADLPECSYPTSNSYACRRLFCPACARDKRMRFLRHVAKTARQVPEHYLWSITIHTTSAEHIRHVWTRDGVFYVDTRRRVALAYGTRHLREEKDHRTIASIIEPRLRKPHRILDRVYGDYPWEISWISINVHSEKLGRRPWLQRRTSEATDAILTFAYADEVKNAFPNIKQFWLTGDPVDAVIGAYLANVSDIEPFYDTVPMNHLLELEHALRSRNEKRPRELKLPKWKEV